MPILYRGDYTFKDICTPVPGKSDWGIDTLTRTLKGARTLLQGFVNTLAQGQVFNGYYLQSWEPDDTDPVWGTIKLQYKGLRSGIPPPVIANAIIESTGSWSHYFDPPYDWGGDEDAHSAVMDVSYYAGQTTYRYLAQNQPGGARYGILGFGFAFSIKRARITLDDGTIFGGNAPVGIVSALTPVLSINAIGFASNPIFGTPYFECEDVVRAELSGGS